MAYIVKHAEWGIFIGTALGRSFWSRLDAAGQDSAVTFESENEVKAYLTTCGWVVLTLTLHEVTPDNGQYISMTALVAQGHDGWMLLDTPTANTLPI